MKSVVILTLILPVLVAMACGGAVEPSCLLPGTPGLISWTTVGLSPGSVQLSWMPSTGTVTSYVIEVGTTIGGTDVAVVDTGSPARSYTLTGLSTSPSVAHHARVRAKNTCGLSGPSVEANPGVAR